MNRPNKIEYYLTIAEAVSLRSTCLRRQYGAVIVKDDTIVSTGYNGSPRGDVNCIDTGKCWREANNIPHGEQYEKCRAVHAEMNAVINAARNGSRVKNGTLYLGGFVDGALMADAVEPCLMCKRVLQNAGIRKVVVRDISMPKGYKTFDIQERKKE